MQADGITCPNCGTVNSAHNVFCQSCGNRLSPPEPQPKPAQSFVTAHYAGSFGILPIYRLGERLDGWADLVPDAADKAAAVAKAASAIPPSLKTLRVEKMLHSAYWKARKQIDDRSEAACFATYIVPSEVGAYGLSKPELMALYDQLETWLKRDGFRIGRDGTKMLKIEWGPQ